MTNLTLSPKDPVYYKYYINKLLKQAAKNNIKVDFRELFTYYAIVFENEIGERADVFIELLEGGAE